MKKFILFFAISLTILSCNSDDDAISNETTVVGSWKLIEVYLDPGDGSGDFEPVTSEKIVEFRANGSVLSNGSICQPSPAIGESTSGTYSTEELIIVSEDCVDTELDIQYRLDGNNLILNYPCIEACSEKYVRL
ncbi:hypothetical protein [Marinirhabdus gelatinilytica]|uniref:Lipocalin-like protein n=1 Tax=Marinirhabdus gelatinilytica TaxID=1703343 RepID=A0A370QL11_9FLAO|nr:hypothetical protein [Marinirhabdus gelatinilytica]RDK89032.1 hypothetical protein C8D94_101911 [Marinirhabdus gelatinilytica]